MSAAASAIPAVPTRRARWTRRYMVRSGAVMVVVLLSGRGGTVAPVGWQRLGATWRPLDGRPPDGPRAAAPWWRRPRRPGPGRRGHPRGRGGGAGSEPATE